MEQTMSSPETPESFKRSKLMRRSSSYFTNSFESDSDDSGGKHKRNLSMTITDDYGRNYESDTFETITDAHSHNYESDSFESTTDEPGTNYESDSYASFSKSVLHQTLSGSEFAECKRNDQETGVIDKWMKILVDGRLHGANSSKTHFETVVYEADESNLVQMYCSRKIQQLRQPSKTQRHKKRHPATYPRSPSSIQQSCHVPHVLMNRLQLQNIKETMKQVMQLEMHDPASCPDCCSKLAELARCQFVRMRKTKLENHLLQEKMEESTYSKNLVTCIGDIHHSLPKPSDESRIIWQRLYNSSKKS